jgi:membrane protein DedA with SNARE-associated domain
MTGFITEMIATWGYLGVFLLMVAENIFPPIPSEVILPLVGFLVADGVLSFPLALLAATAGAFVGTLFWFYIGWFISVERIEHWLTRYGVYVAISAEDFRRATTLFNRWQIPAVFFGRMLPTIRTVISLPAGSIKMRFVWYTIATLAGTTLWSLLLMGAGFYLQSSYLEFESYIDPFVNLLIAVIVGVYVLQVCRFWYRQYRQSHE